MAAKYRIRTTSLVGGCSGAGGEKTLVIFRCQRYIIHIILNSTYYSFYWRKKKHFLIPRGTQPSNCPYELNNEKQDNKVPSHLPFPPIFQVISRTSWRAGCQFPPHQASLTPRISLPRGLSRGVNSRAFPPLRPLPDTPNYVYPRSPASA